MPVGIRKFTVLRDVSVVFAYKDNAVYKLHTVLALRVILHSHRFIREIVIVPLLQERIVGVFRGSDIDLDVEPVVGDGVSRKTYFTRSIAETSSVTENQLGHIRCVQRDFAYNLILTVCAHDNIDVSSCIAVFVGCSTLTGVIAVNELPVIEDCVSALVNALNIRILYIVFLVIRKVGAVDFDNS